MRRSRCRCRCIDAWVAIGLSGESIDPATFKAPVLDLYGEKDLPAVLNHAEKRAAALRQVRGSGQVQVAGVDHFFAGMENELARQVRLFLHHRLKKALRHLRRPPAGEAAGGRCTPATRLE